MFRHLLKVILRFVKVNKTIRSRPSRWFWDQTHLTWVFRFDWILLLLFKTTVKWIFRWRVSILIFIINRFIIFQLKTFLIITFIFLVDLWHLFIACVISWPFYALNIVTRFVKELRVAVGDVMLHDMRVFLLLLLLLDIYNFSNLIRGQFFHQKFFECIFFIILHFCDINFFIHYTHGVSKLFQFFYFKFWHWKNFFIFRNKVLQKIPEIISV